MWAMRPASSASAKLAVFPDGPAMDAERLNQIAASIDDLRRRHGELRRYL